MLAFVPFPRIALHDNQGERCGQTIRVPCPAATVLEERVGPIYVFWWGFLDCLAYSWGAETGIYIALKCENFRIRWKDFGGGL